MKPESFLKSPKDQSQNRATTIHPTAIIDPDVELGQDVEVGPYCVISGPVQLGDRVKLLSHVAISGNTSIGEESVIYPFASLGFKPQDLKFKGEASRLEIGARNQIREHTTMNPGTMGGGMLTKVGSDCLFMVGSHVAHDCIIGDHVILANNAALAGHVTIGDHAIIGGLAAIRQFVRIGHHAMIGGMSGVENDVIPYGMVVGERGRLAGLNIVGLERHGFSRDDIHTLRQLYKQIFFGTDTFASRLDAALEKYASIPVAANLINFIKERTDNALCKPRDISNDGATS